jgi:hypothetical protein
MFLRVNVKKRIEQVFDRHFQPPLPASQVSYRLDLTCFICRAVNAVTNSIKIILMRRHLRLPFLMMTPLSTPRVSNGDTRYEKNCIFEKIFVADINFFGLFTIYMEDLSY